MVGDSGTPKKIGPWTRLSSYCEYQNPWIQVNHEKVITPAGSEGIYGKIHFKNRAIGVIPVDEEGYTWLVGQHRYALDEYSWEIPMGGGGLDQPPLAAAQKELKEETGFSAKNWQQLMKLHTSNSVTDEEAYVFLATGLEAGEQALEATEADLILQRLPFKEAVDMVVKGQITDAISVAGLLFVERSGLVAPINP